MLNKEMSLQELVLYKAKLEAELPDGELVPDEVTEMVEVASMLLEGRVDRAGQFRDGLIAHIAAMNAQLVNMKEMLDMTEALMTKAVNATEKKRLDGLAYSLRVQTNGGSPSTIIDDESKIPLAMKKVTVTSSFLYNDDDMIYWARAAIGRLVEWKKDLTEQEISANPFYRLDIASNERERLERLFSIETSKSAIAASIKNNSPVPGAHQERGSHLRVVAGKAKTQELSHA